ncbi:Gfo/Idh/MocA family protein [Streptomyces sp. NPDC001351]|uniref:Gfo/Idh/MocA family protein n=1 Tax=Streptomyces sp. NPDC001351 TaxID=3364564 RepID=UPI0036A3F627
MTFPLAAGPAPPLRVAVAGMGWSGRRWIKVVDRTPGVRLAAVVSRSANWPSPASPEMAGVRTSMVLKEALSWDDVDCVVVCSPPERQVVEALAVVRAAKAVIVEKPCGLDTAALATLIRETERRGTPAMAGYHLAVNPLLLDLASRTAAGDFGRPEHASFRMYVDRARPHQDWLVDPDRSGGPIVETLVHGFHLSQQVIGTVASVETAVTSGPTARGGFGALVVLRHENGCVTTLETSWQGSAAVRSGFFEMLGSDGGFGLDRGFSDRRQYATRAESRGELTTQSLADDDVGFSSLLIRLRRALHGEPEAIGPVSLPSAMAALELALTARRIARTTSGRGLTRTEHLQEGEHPG